MPAHSCLLTVAYCQLPALRCLFFVACSQLPADGCLLSVTCCQMPALSCLLTFACSQFPANGCLLTVSCSQLPAGLHCQMPVVSCCCWLPVCNPCLYNCPLPRDETNSFHYLSTIDLRSIRIEIANCLMISFAKLAASLQNENWLIQTALGYHKFNLFRTRDRILVRRPSYRKILTELGGHHNMLQGQLIFVLRKKRWHSKLSFQFITSVDGSPFRKVNWKRRRQNLFSFFIRTWQMLFIHILL